MSAPPCGQDGSCSRWCEAVEWPGEGIAPTLGREICPALKIFKKNMPFELIEEFPCGSLEFFYALFVSTAFFSARLLVIFVPLYHGERQTQNFKKSYLLDYELSLYFSVNKKISIMY